YDFEGGLKEHYGRLWEYKQAILDSNPESTCRLDDEETSSGNNYFKRIYVCFKGVKDGWLAGCKKMIGLDGCFLNHTCRGELLVAMGRDSNNQMYPIAWVLVKVKNNENWCWFLALLHDDLNLQQGNGLTVISDSHKDVASTTLEQRFYSKTEEMKVVSQEAYEYLILRNPNSWCRAFFRLKSKCPNFENGNCESFNMAILVQRTKPIITILKDIILYLMQILVSINRIARTYKDIITPSIRKRIELLKEEQRFWIVIPSGFQELEVRKGHGAYGMNIQLRTCQTNGGMGQSSNGRGQRGGGRGPKGGGKGQRGGDRGPRGGGRGQRGGDRGQRCGGRGQRGGGRGKRGGGRGQLNIVFQKEV
ncbi:hypothetical protein Tco_0958706, partial [Tanacetum coccineum]